MKSPGPRVIVALDFPDMMSAFGLAARLDPAVCAVKVGKELFTAAEAGLVRELVRRHRGRQDRRFVTVTLTDKGRRLIGGIFPRHVRHVVRELGALSPPEQAELGRLCRQLGLAGRRERTGKERSNGAQSHPLRLARAL